ncbi:hypothetical protein Tco_1295616, partial [Tanacetum coccineum]
MMRIVCNPELMYLIVIVAECPLKDLSRNLKLTTSNSSLGEDWYVVPTGKDNFIVSAGRPNMVPAGRIIVSPGSIILGP